MSHFLDRLNFFDKVKDTFSDDHGIVTNEWLSESLAS